MNWLLRFTFVPIFVLSLAVVMVVFAVACQGLRLWDAIQHKKRVRARLKAMHAAFAARPRARIVSAGRVVVDALGREHASEMTLDCRGIIPAHSWGPNGEELIGYTHDELVEIAKRPAEFVEPE